MQSENLKLSGKETKMVKNGCALVQFLLTFALNHQRVWHMVCQYAGFDLKELNYDENTDFDCGTGCRRCDWY